MPKESVVVSAVVAASPSEVYEAWLDSAAHTSMTGGAASIDATVGGRHSAWEGYISGITLVLEPHRRIVQSWRSAEFPEDASDSQVELLLEDAIGGHTRITIQHTEIPEGQGAQYESGWREHYFRPMARFFAERGEGAIDEVVESTPETQPLPRVREVLKPRAEVHAKPAKPAPAPAKKAKAKPKKAAAKSAKAAPKKAAPKKAASKARKPAKASKKHGKAAPKRTAKVAAKASKKKAAPKKTAHKSKKAAHKAAPKKAAHKKAKRKATRR